MRLTTGKWQHRELINILEGNRTRINADYTDFREYKMLHQELTSKIIGAYYKVYNSLGYGFLEKVFSNSNKKSAMIR